MTDNNPEPAETDRSANEAAMNNRHSSLAVPVVLAGRLLTAAEFQRLADVPPELEWFANLNNQATRRAYENALQDFMK